MKERPHWKTTGDLPATRPWIDLIEVAVLGSKSTTVGRQELVHEDKWLSA